MIYIDDRAGSNNLPPHIQRNIPTTLTRLPFGDCMWTGNGPDNMPVPIGVEYKSVSDLCNCITTGRLSGHQLLGMLNEYWRSYLLIEGIWRGNPDNGLLECMHYGTWTPLSLGRQQFMASTVTNYLSTLAVMCGVVVWQTSTIYASGAWLSDTYRWWQKDWTKHNAHKQFHTPQPLGIHASLARPSLVCRVAKELTGVGYDKAEAISKSFGSVKGLVEANEKDLMLVDGIGKTLAKRIVQELDGGC
jgi:ERCC4-type nuclease